MDILKKIIIAILEAIKNYIIPKPVPIPPTPNPEPKPDPKPDPLDPIYPEPFDPNPRPTPIPDPKPIPPPTPEPEPDPIPEPIPDKIPGDNVNWLKLEVQRNDQNASWGSFLTDVHNHLPKQYGSQYFDNDRITHCHETTHGINSHVSNLHNSSGRKNYGFYVGGGNYCIVEQPNITIEQVANSIPSSLKGSRYKLYLVDQRRDWNKDPMYLADEFLAYTAGAQTGLEVANSLSTVTDVIIGPLEFAIYAIFIIATAQKNDPEFVKTNNQFKEFFAYSLRRALSIYKKGIVLKPFQWDNKLEKELMNSQVCKDVLYSLYGNSLTLEMLLK